MNHEFRTFRHLSDSGCVGSRALLLNGIERRHCQLRVLWRCRYNKLADGCKTVACYGTEFPRLVDLMSGRSKNAEDLFPKTWAMLNVTAVNRSREATQPIDTWIHQFSWSTLPRHLERRYYIFAFPLDVTFGDVFRCNKTIETSPNLPRVSAKTSPGKMSRTWDTVAW